METKEELLARLLKMWAETVKENRTIFYAWCAASTDYWCNHLKKCLADKGIDPDDFEKAFRGANGYDLSQLVETEYDYTACSKEKLAELLALYEKAFEDVEGSEPEDELYGFDYDTVYSGWEEVYSALEKKIKTVKALLPN